MKERDYQGPDSRAVQQMFTGIAPRYDFLNHFLSASVDRHWRRAAVKKVRELTTARLASTLCLDVCSGTGDLAIALHRNLKSRVVASDFCHAMLTRANAKITAAGMAPSIHNVEGDTLRLPFPEQSFHAVTAGFGLRNLEDFRLGLEEMHRVLKSGGVLVILEFSKPVAPVFKHLFNFYFRCILPKLGAAISGDEKAYQYLPDSVGKFPEPIELAALMSAVGFQQVDYVNLTGGIAALHWGKK
jgi:demethylmenaquinone methyltransferase/2-methoxy-6-polyprenyl-1,4-benzoquinol methylase